MHKQEDLQELKNDVERAFSAALYSMDYFILRTIIDTSKESKVAYKKQNYQKVLFTINKGFWEIGVCINKKLNNYRSVTPEFFDDIASNIKRYLKYDKNIAFSQANLKRCYKLVNMANASWFDCIARQISWQYIANAIDETNSFDELKKYLKDRHEIQINNQ